MAGSRISAFVGALGLQGCQNWLPERPNILYIMADDHAAEAIGAYGSRLARLNLTGTIP